jgi:hypothetical protein
VRLKMGLATFGLCVSWFTPCSFNKLEIALFMNYLSR